MKSLLFIGLITCSTAGFGADRVLLETPVTYQPNAGVIDKVKQECQIEDMLERRVGAALDGVNKSRGSTVPAGTVPPDAAVLRLQISHVMGAGGGGWSGPKSLSVSAELLENGKTVRQTKVNRWTTGGVFGGFKGTCSMFERAGTAVAKDLARWVRDPAYNIPDEAAPKQTGGDAAPPPAASAAQ